MILNRFSFSSLFIHIFFFIYVLFLFGSKKTKENDIKKLNIINTNLIGIIDQSKESKKTPEDLEEKNNIQNKEIVKIEDTIEEKKRKL